MITRLVQRYQQSGSTADRQRSGRPRISSAAQNRYIRVIHMRTQTVTARKTTLNVPDLRRISAQTVRNCFPWKRLTHQTSLLWRSTETSASTCKSPMVQQSKGLGPAKLEASLVQRRIKIHAAENKCLQTPEWEVRKELRPWGRQFRRRKCDDVGYHILRRKTQLVHIHGNLNAARHRDEVLTPHMLPAMDLRKEVFSARQHSGRTQLVLLLTF